VRRGMTQGKQQIYGLDASAARRRPCFNAKGLESVGDFTKYEVAIVVGRGVVEDVGLRCA
jgi:hypothetical protein